MRHLELSADLPASAEAAWAVLIDTDDWPSWGRLVVAAEGELVAGHQWCMTLGGGEGRPTRTLRPRFVSMVPGRQLVFETRLGASWIVRMVHTFEVLPAGPTGSVLRQSFAITGLLVAPLWGVLHRGMVQFEALGADLALRLG
ncbi:MAG: hypothetical protein ACI8RZ_007728 [Myxococcota bacterium]|jgi:hypothetical protein